MYKAEKMIEIFRIRKNYHSGGGRNTENRPSFIRFLLLLLLLRVLLLLRAQHETVLLLEPSAQLLFFSRGFLEGEGRKGAKKSGRAVSGVAHRWRGRGRR